LWKKVKQWWTSYSFQGSPSFVQASKLKALKVDWKKWNEKVFGKVVLLDKLRDLDVIAKERSLFEFGKVRKADIASILEIITLLEKVSWSQKSTALCLREGDKNTIFFPPTGQFNQKEQLH
jgi:hypothetical protein